MVAEIFLYTPDADINSTHLQALRKAGFVPVKVKSMDAVKVMQMPLPIPQANLDAILGAAMATMTEFSTTSAVAGTFGMRLAERLLQAEAHPA